MNCKLGLAFRNLYWPDETAKLISMETEDTSLRRVTGFTEHPPLVPTHISYVSQSFVEKNWSSQYCEKRIIPLWSTKEYEGMEVFSTLSSQRISDLSHGDRIKQHISNKKNKKYVGINLTEVKDLYLENY